MVRTMGEEYNQNVLERDLRASRYRLEGYDGHPAPRTDTIYEMKLTIT